MKIETHLYRTAEILVVGSEFFSRFKQDSNSIWLTEQLENRGVRVLAKRTVADDLDTLAAAYTEALSRVDLVISTGGLGPTIDDRTRDAFARATGRDLEFRQDLCDELEKKFRSRGRVMAENNLRQVWIPATARVLTNARGTAPGFYLHHGRSTALALPGPPNEMTHLFRDFREACAARFPTDATITVARTLKVSGLGESDMDQRIADLYLHLENPEVTINFTANDLEIHLTARAPSTEEAEALLEPLIDGMVQRLDVHLYSLEGQTLAQVVSDRLRDRGETLAVAESLTGGLLAHRLASVPGASLVFRGGVVAYTEAAKVEVLGVRQATIDEYGVVSEQVASEMAQCAERLLKADYALSCTGYAGPSGGSDKDPVGTAYVGFHASGGTLVSRVSLPGDRNILRARLVQNMLFMLYRHLVSA